MPIIDPDQGVPLPAGTDLADNPVAFSNFYTPVMSRLILRYVDDADRTARHPAPVLNETSILDNATWYDRWTGSKWLPCTAISVFSQNDQIVNNSTVLVNSTELVIPLPTANSSWAITAMLRYNSNTTADIKFTFAGPAGSGFVLGAPALAVGSATDTGDANFGQVVAPGTLPSAGTGVDVILPVTGVATTAAATGNMMVQFAQNTANPSNTTLNALSWLMAQAIS